MPLPTARLVEPGQVATPSGQEICDMTTQTATAATTLAPVQTISRGANAPANASHPLLAAVAGCGRRGADRPMTSVLVAYWMYLARSTAAERASLLEELRKLVRAGETTPRAWAAVALGDCEFSIVRDAVSGYLGGGVASIERRARAAAEAIDWIRRGLSLNRAAVFTALLELGDEDTNEQLAGLRTRLADEEAIAVWQACAHVESEATRVFIAEWREFCGC